MKLQSVAIFVANIEKSTPFYTNFLGLKILNNMGKNVELSNGITLWECNRNHIIASNLDTNSPSNRFELYLETDDIQAEYLRLKELDVTFFHPIQTEPWGQRTFRFFDPDKHLIEVGESMPITIKNMLNSGLSIHEIGKKTGLNENEISKYQ